jgi:hypothetical protein
MELHRRICDDIERRIKDLAQRLRQGNTEWSDQGSPRS